MKFLDNARGWIASGAVAMVVLAAMSWLLLFSPKLSSTSTVHEQTDSMEITNAGLTAEIASLKKQSYHIDNYVAKLVKARLQLPITSALPAFADESHGHATSTGVELTSMSVGSVTLAGAAAAASVAAGVAAPSTAGAAGQLYAVPVTLVSNGHYQDQLRFLQRLQYTGPRVALISGVRFGGTDASTNLDRASMMTTSLILFVAPETPAEAKVLQKQLAGHR